MKRDNEPVSDEVFLDWVRRAVDVSRRDKVFDTRLLDRLESYCSQYRHWHGEDVVAAGYPYGYIESQKEAYRMELRNAAQAVADALRD